MIPDSINPEELQRRLLAAQSGVPWSSCFPEIDFGGIDGGACDLQLALNQLVCQSKGGVTPLQQLTAICFMLSEIINHFNEQLKLVISKEDPYDKIPDRMLTLMSSSMLSHKEVLSSALASLTGLTNAALMIHTRMKTERWRDQGQHPETMDSRQLASAVVIGDPYLRSISMERQVLEQVLFDASDHE